MVATEPSTGPFAAEVTVRRIRYVSADRGWAVLEVADDDGSELVLVGPLGHLEQRERARVTGSWVDDPRHGPQVKVSQATPLPPADAESVTLYLKRVKQIGARRAAKLIDRFGAEQVLDVIDADPETAFASAGLTGYAVRAAIDSWERLRATRRLHLLLAPHGLAYLVGRIHDAYGDQAHAVVSERPYELTSVFGVGFLIADRIARGLGCPPDDPERARAGVLHLLSEAERSGSTCMPLDALLDGTKELLGHRPGESLIDRLVAQRDLARIQHWIYRLVTAELEAELAGRVRRLVADAPSDRVHEPSDASSPPPTSS
jgi:exodeoxyribonuclease V alpha subunit